MIQTRCQDNILPVWKPEMMTSAEVVRQVKTRFNLKKIGHCGTLDPFADGVLVLVSGKETALAEKYMSKIKIYEATIVLGAKTDTLDRMGEVIYKDKKIERYSEDQIKKVLLKFIGNINQRPPSFSAKRINGVRLYKLARKDIFVHLKAVPVVIEDIHILSYKNNILKLEVKSQKGTYIRQLGNDIAKELGTFGYLQSLTRTSVGEFNSDNVLQLKEIDTWKNIQK